MSSFEPRAVDNERDCKSDIGVCKVFLLSNLQCRGIGRDIARYGVDDGASGMETTRGAGSGRGGSGFGSGRSELAARCRSEATSRSSFSARCRFSQNRCARGRLPLWNDLWGFGFPGVGESQMGVFYPPHWLLYGCLPVEMAYTASLVLHSLWGALGAYFAARRFGASPTGAALGAFAWSACGFFDIHQPHQWGYTTGSWMPWAWGLTWSITRGDGTLRTPFLLAGVLTLQILPGHFQLAFITQVSLVALAIAGATSWRRLLCLGLSTLGALAWRRHRYGRRSDWRGSRQIVATSNTFPGSRKRPCISSRSSRRLVWTFTALASDRVGHLPHLAGGNAWLRRVSAVCFWQSARWVGAGGDRRACGG